MVCRYRFRPGGGHVRSLTWTGALPNFRNTKGCSPDQLHRACHQRRNPDSPVNAVPTYAKATCQIRHTVDVSAEVFLPALRKHLDAHGFAHVPTDTDIVRDRFLASPWVQRFRRSVVTTSWEGAEHPAVVQRLQPSELLKARLGASAV